MATAVDFRTLAYDQHRVEASAKDLGKNVYWKLYVIENVLRVLVNSVLLVQVGPDWWSKAVSKTIAEKAQYVRKQYEKKPWHSSPGGHDLYCLFLPDLNEIVRVNAHLIRPVVKDVDQWIARIDQIHLPRNIVGHMNWPHKTDRQRIEVVHADIVVLADVLVSSGIKLVIP